MESNKAEIYFSPVDAHAEAVNVQGMEDLFQWASETVADGLDGRQRRAREQMIKRQVLNIVHRTADSQAQAKYVNELAYMQRRVIALQGALLDAQQEMSNLKQSVVAQYVGMQRIPELEEKIILLEMQNVQREKAEQERRILEDDRKFIIEEERKIFQDELKAGHEECNHLMNALAKLKKDRDFLDELVTVNESENARLTVLLSNARKEIEDLKARRWWHALIPFKK